MNLIRFLVRKVVGRFSRGSCWLVKSGPDGSTSGSTGVLRSIDRGGLRAVAVDSSLTDLSSSENRGSS